MSGHDRVDWNDAPADARAWVVDSNGDAYWLRWDVARERFGDGHWLQPGMTNDVQRSMTPADLFDWDISRPWLESLTYRP